MNAFSDSVRQLLREFYGLDGKTVLVTGASKGIGQAVARTCASAGARLIISGRDKPRLEATLGSLAGTGHRALIAELTDAAALKQLANDCGPVDGVVHSAGILRFSPARMFSDAMLQETFNVNFMAPVMLTRHLLAQNAIRSGGSIVFMSSISALAGAVGGGVYAGSKAALLGTLRPLALELAKKRIRANALCPGLVETDMVTEDRTFFEKNRDRYPLGIGQPSDIANACLYLLSSAGSKITGQAYSIDGGIDYL